MTDQSVVSLEEAIMRAQRLNDYHNGQKAFTAHLLSKSHRTATCLCHSIYSLTAIDDAPNNPESWCSASSDVLSSMSYHWVPSEVGGREDEEEVGLVEEEQEEPEEPVRLYKMSSATGGV